MPRKYVVGKVIFVFEDDYRTIIHQNDFDLDNEAHLASFVIGSRVELHDDGKKFIGTIKDVKHLIAADSSNNYVDSVQVHCGQSYEIT